MAFCVQRVNNLAKQAVQCTQQAAVRHNIHRPQVCVHVPHACNMYVKPKSRPMTYYRAIFLGTCCTERSWDKGERMLYKLLRIGSSISSSRGNLHLPVLPRNRLLWFRLRQQVSNLSPGLGLPPVPNTLYWGFTVHSLSPQT